MIHLAWKAPGGGGVPSPVDGDPTIPWPLDTWAKLMPLFAAYGGTVAVTPPLTKGASLGAGYDLFDHYDLGSKVQGGRRETRYGDVDLAMAFVAKCRALGMETYVNVVHHHVDGDRGDQVFTYLGADGKTHNGRFPKDQHCFCQTWPNPDTVADSSWDLAFGREFMWNLGTYADGLGDNGPGYVRRGLVAALDWQTRRLGVDGYFLDDAKGTSIPYVGYLLTRGAMADKVAFSEYSDGQTGNLMRWMAAPPIHQRCGVMDFPLRYKIQNVLDHGADMREVMWEGVCWVDPANAVTFIEDADVDLSDPIKFNKLLGYAMILTMPGYPMVFGKDMYPAPEGYGLMTPVLNLVWIHETFAKGDMVWRSTSSQHLVYERMGDQTTSGILVGLSSRYGSLGHAADWTPVRVRCKWVNTMLHDYTGHSNDVWTDTDGNVTLWLPPNDNGHGYVVFAPAGVTNVIALAPRETLQTYFGADDLDSPAAHNGVMALGTISVAAGSPLKAACFLHEKITTALMMVHFIAPDGSTVISPSAPVEGTYTVQLECIGFPVEGAKFEVDIGYHAPRLPVVRAA